MRGGRHAIYELTEIDKLWLRVMELDPNFAWRAGDDEQRVDVSKDAIEKLWKELGPPPAWRRKILCKKHRDYRARRKPKVPCDQCVKAWNDRHPKDRVKIIFTNDFLSPNEWAEVIDC